MELRHKLILDFWNRSRQLTVSNKEYSNFANKLLSALLKEDTGKGDITTNTLIKGNNEISAEITAKEDGILAGVEEFRLLNKDLKITSLKKDGDGIKKGDLLVKLKGDAKKILERERFSLNMLQRMSGIATITDNLVRKINNQVKIAATRKTLWGDIDKKAVSIGGGLTHRLNLSDCILIKDNHLKILHYDIKKALTMAKNKSKYIEIEVENKKQAIAAAKTIKELDSNSLFAIMLDNMSPKEIKETIKQLKAQHLYGNILFEASGNITNDNIKQYLECGADVISSGFITNSAKALNISQEIK